MAVEKEYWNIPKPSEDFLTAQGKNLTVLVDHAHNSIFWGLSASDITAVASVLIAVCALAVSIKQARSASKVSRISVRPHLQLSTKLFEKNSHFKVLIENNGLGPAFINSFEVSLDGVPLLGLGDKISEAISQIKTPNTAISTTYFQKGYAIKDGQEKILLELSFIDLNPEHGYDLTSFIKEIVKRVTIKINYEDGFGKKMPTTISDNSL